MKWIKKILGDTENEHEDDQGQLSFMQEHEERVLRAMASGESYGVETFQKIWDLINFSDSEILGINWEEKDRAKIERRLITLGLKKVFSSKSPAIISFDFGLVLGDTVDGFITLLNNRGIECSFGFIDKKADKLIGWLEEKYGKSLELIEETETQRYYDWISGNILISVEVAKLSGLADVALTRKPDFINLIRGEISLEEFSKKSNNMAN